MPNTAHHNWSFHIHPFDYQDDEGRAQFFRSIRWMLLVVVKFNYISRLVAVKKKDQYDNEYIHVYVRFRNRKGVGGATDKLLFNADINITAHSCKNEQSSLVSDNAIEPLVCFGDIKLKQIFTFIDWRTLVTFYRTRKYTYQDALNRCTDIQQRSVVERFYWNADKLKSMVGNPNYLDHLKFNSDHGVDLNVIPVDEEGLNI